MQFRRHLLVKVNAGNHKAQLTVRTVGRPKLGWLDDINGRMETVYKKVAQKCLDREDWS